MQANNTAAAGYTGCFFTLIIAVVRGSPQLFGTFKKYFCITFDKQSFVGSVLPRSRSEPNSCNSSNLFLKFVSKLLFFLSGSFSSRLPQLRWMFLSFLPAQKIHKRAPLADYSPPRGAALIDFCSLVASAFIKQSRL